VKDRPGAHWVDYTLEAWGLGLFMVSACGFGVLLFHPASPVVHLLPNELARRSLMGLAMGLTNVLNIYSPWGRRSGAHLNPAVTWTFHRLGKVSRRDAIGYSAFQFAGGVIGTQVGAVLFRPWIADPSVNYVATVPGRWGLGPAFVGEVVITFVLMSVILAMVARPAAARYTGLAASTLVWIYITLEAPISGMSMNPARTLGSAIPAQVWTGLWIYLLAPPLGMLAAAQIRHWATAGQHPFCAKMRHDLRYRCIFCNHRPTPS
jgi:aquaporin Z